MKSGLFLVLFLCLFLSLFCDCCLAGSTDFDVFLDSDCLWPCTDINWGGVSPSGSVVRVVYLKNFGDSSIVYVDAVASNFEPEFAESVLNISCYVQPAYLPLAAGHVAPVSLVLYVSSYVKGLTSFDFDVDVVAYFNEESEASSTYEESQASSEGPSSDNYGPPAGVIGTRKISSSDEDRDRGSLFSELVLILGVGFVLVWVTRRR